MDQERDGRSCGADEDAVNTDPTANNDAVGYLLHLASMSAWNGREEALAQKCAEYLRGVVAELEEARAVLREVEWASHYAWTDLAICPSCSHEPPCSYAPNGHAPDCRLAAVLGEGR